MPGQEFPASPNGNEPAPVSRREPAAGRGTRNLRKHVALQLALAVVLALGYYATVRRAVHQYQPAGIDEYGWIVASDLTYKAMLSKERADPQTWHAGFLRRPWGAINPNFAKLIMGFALHCWGYDLGPPAFFPDSRSGQPAWPQLTWPQRERAGRAYRPYIVKMRWLVLCTGAACAVALYFVGRALSGPLLGIGAYVGFISTPLVALMSFTVYTDNLLLLMSLLSIWATVVFARWWASAKSVHSPGRTIVGALLIAGLYGCTVATKLNGAPVCIACALAAVILWAAHRFRHHKAWTTPVVFIGVAFAALGVFVLLNPQLHDNVPRRIAWLITRWGELIAKQQHDLDMFAITSFESQVHHVWKRAVLTTGPCVYFLPIAAAILIGVGFVLICRRGVVGWRGGGGLVGPGFLITWAAVVVVMTTLWLPLDWPRYYLPLVPVFCLLQAVPVESGLRLCAKRWRAHAAAQSATNRQGHGP